MAAVTKVGVVLLLFVVVLLLFVVLSLFVVVCRCWFFFRCSVVVG